jgi:2-keto-4-pentenoate hydratase/2-oxohepta-3-ene-1,7-dioic acid hydratase in catechol pathway
VRIARFTTGDEPKFGVVGDRDGTTVVAVLTGDPLYAGITLTGQSHPLDNVRLLAPLIPRSKVVGIGRNYADHASELDNELPSEPLMFLKPNTSVIGPGEPIVHPEQTEELHWEAELAVVIGRICRSVPPEQVRDVLLGYTVANDVTARDLQRSDDQWTRAKGFDSFCPLGPWIETDLDVSDLRVSTVLHSGGPGGTEETRQDGRTSQMIFDVATLVSKVSEVMTLLPGDVILTGTPAGVGRMVPGDRVTVTVEGIGSLTNPVVAA